MYVIENAIERTRKNMCECYILPTSKARLFQFRLSHIGSLYSMNEKKSIEIISFNRIPMTLKTILMAF